MYLLNKKSGMTLTELLVSSMLVGIIITGALSSDYAIRTWQKRIEERILTQMDLTIALEVIVKYGWSAVGTGVNEGTTLDFGAAINYYKDSLWEYIGFTQSDGTIVVFFHDIDDSVYLTRYDTVPSGEHIFDDPTFLKISDPDFFDLNFDADGKLQSVKITLTTRFAPSLTEGSLDNQDFTLETSFLPPGLSQ
ncbi:MAG: type II secretion system protein [Candidatus Omnitrophota bacterium]